LAFGVYLGYLIRSIDTMKSFSIKIVTILIGLLIVLLETSCQIQPATQTMVKAPADPNVVAKIGDYVIMKEELEKRLLTELHPKEYEPYRKGKKPANPKSTLLNMIVEKAMIIEAREQGYTEDDYVKSAVDRYTNGRLINILIQNYLQQVKEKITATESEIKQRTQADPNMNPARIKRIIENEKARNMVSEYYKQIYEKLHTKKLAENYPKAVQIHERLLNHPKTPQKLKFIRATQIKDEMTTKEKNIVLATYDYGKITMEDFLKTLCEFSPPSRPKNLNTTKGVEQFLDRALAKPLYITEAKLLKLDEDENFLKQVKEQEDRSLLNKVKGDTYKQIEEPSAEQIVDYYNNNKELFKSDNIKIDVIWCQDRNTAKQVKAELKSGKDFESVKQELSLEKKMKPFNTGASREQFFWKDLWEAEPNDIVGPIKGFYRQGINWRIVKILEKNPGEVKEYSTNMDYMIKNMIISEQRETLLDNHRSKLLKKYPYEIYHERIKDIDPLSIP
jgi:hypothetical protein